jgi:uncharacterized circularly permuted ATP-grasp superfamily protein/uncharacterized alpha-E superfamily protein
MVEPGGGIAAGWRGLAERLGRTSSASLDRRERRAQRILDDHGSLVAGAPDDRPTRIAPLDVIPFQLGHAEAAELQRGVAQRAMLLNRLVADLLGEQRVLRERILPPALLFGNPHYRRAYHDLPVAGQRYIHLLGADVVQTGDGRWWVTSDLTQAPTGLGLALENRIASSRVHADWFNAMQVRRYTRFFATLRETLTSLAPRNRRNPRVVLLSEGPDGQRSFEDAFLARHLGLTLTVGEDLATRRGQTILKTLGGGVPVEVIFRRIDDDACDPVELDPMAADGVAGLVESQRQAQVSIVNMLGSQLVEVPGMLAFLGPLCRFLLDEDLLLPSAATWWCGQASEREHVIANLESLDLRPAFSAGAPRIPTRGLDAAARAALVAEIEARPEAFVGQERTAGRSAPVWREGRMEPWSWRLRSFAVLGADQYDVLPGGLVVNEAPAAPAVTPAASDHGLPSVAGQRLQDCWVISDRPVDRTALPSIEEGIVSIRRGGSELPSRVAEHLHALGRRVDAIENRARLLRALLGRVDRDDEDEIAEGSGDLQAMLGLVGGGSTTIEQAPAMLRAATFGPSAAVEGTETLAAMILDVLRIARSVRDRISTDAWRILTGIERHMAEASVEATSGPEDLAELAATLDQLVLELTAFTGLVSEGMTRTLAWRFLDMGRRIERATHLAGLLHRGLVRPVGDERAMLELILEICDSGMTYRSRYRAELRAGPMLDLLVTDELNPRGIAFQLVTLDEHLSRLPGTEETATRDLEQRLAIGLLAAVRLAEPDELAGIRDGVRTQLDALLERITVELPRIEQSVAARHLVHAGLPKQFASVDLVLRPRTPAAGDAASDGAGS